MAVEILDFLMGYDSYLRTLQTDEKTSSIVTLVSSLSLSSISVYLNLKVVNVFSFHLRFFTDLLLRLRADISKVTAHERIQHLYLVNKMWFVCLKMFKNISWRILEAPLLPKKNTRFSKLIQQL
jgi:hypothetical protein